MVICAPALIARTAGRSGNDNTPMLTHTRESSGSNDVPGRIVGRGCAAMVYKHTAPQKGLPAQKYKEREKNEKIIDRVSSRSFNHRWGLGRSCTGAEREVGHLRIFS